VKSLIKEKVLRSCSIVTLFGSDIQFSNTYVLEDFPSCSVFKGSKADFKEIFAVYSTRN